VTCHFCKDPAVNVCGWLVPKFVVDKAGALVVGDRVKSYHGRGGSMAVIGIERLARGSGTAMTLRLRAPSGQPVDMGTFTDYAVQVERPRPCGVMVCEAHVRDLDGAMHCQDHWQAWEAVA
jgi:hypothetical protein